MIIGGVRVMERGWLGKVVGWGKVAGKVGKVAGKVGVALDITVASAGSIAASCMVESN